MFLLSFRLCLQPSWTINILPNMSTNLVECYQTSKWLGVNLLCSHLDDFPETMRKLCLSTKFLRHEIWWNFGVFIVGFSVYQNSATSYRLIVAEKLFLLEVYGGTRCASEFPLRNIPKFNIISWYRNFVDSGDLSETLQKMCLFRNVSTPGN